jgi:N-acetylglutamate synthase-like GNAT family acetyltransferase
MGKFIKLNKEYTKIYNEYIDKYFYENLYLSLDFSRNFNDSKRTKKAGDFYGYIKSEKLLGVFVFSNNNILHLSFIDKDVLKKVDLFRAIKYYKPKIIKGKKENLEDVISLFEKSISKIKTNDYYIMKYNNKAISVQGTDVIDSECVNNSFDFLVNVEKEFDRNPKLLNDIKSKILNKYKKNEYFAYTDNNRIIAQGMLENKGDKYIVIGGIYIGKEYRRQGYGKKIVGKLVNKVISDKKTPILLVKKNNTNAISLYKKIGFEEMSDFRIVELIIM